jgi:hypothetical protein
MGWFTKNKALPRECTSMISLDNRDIPEKVVRKLFKKIMPYLKEEESTVLFDKLREDGYIFLRLTHKEFNQFDDTSYIKTRLDVRNLTSPEDWQCCGGPCDSGCALKATTSEYWSATNPGLIEEGV